MVKNRQMNKFIVGYTQTASRRERELIQTNSANGGTASSEAVPG